MLSLDYLVYPLVNQLKLWVCGQKGRWECRQEL